jgi:hydroxymethylpyrimidine/phosphomethylpyrimidine kinase
MADHRVPPAMLRDQIDAVLEEIGVDVVKVGMLHSPDIVRTWPMRLTATSCARWCLTRSRGRPMTPSCLITRHCRAVS